MGLHLTEPATFTAACIADRTGDGNIDFFDMADFLVDLKAMDPSADINGDSNWNFFDVNLFTTAFNAGCP